MKTVNSAADESSAPSLAQQRNVWLSQAASPPSLQCGKDEMFPSTLELLREIAEGKAIDLDAAPTLPDVKVSRKWRQYLPALRAMGVVENRRGVPQLTPDGDALLADGSRSRLATLLAGRVRLFAEALGLLVNESLTVEEVNTELVNAYNLDWASLSNTRQRLTWLEVLGLIEWLGKGKLTATSAGRALFETWETVTPAAVAFEDAAEVANFPDAPIEVAALLEQLSSSASAQEARNTYNIWVPSPNSDPSKIENMRTSIAAAAEPIEKDELLTFIAKRFGLKRSSVDSMLPFMRAGGFLQEVRRGVFVATPAAKAWLRSGSDIDFIRILHGNMRFIGELIRAARENVARSDVYHEGLRYGMNKEKIRWLIAFMIEAGLLIETSWSSVQATPTGRRFVETLPLADPLTSVEAQPGTNTEDLTDVLRAQGTHEELSAAANIAEQLLRTANDPSADGKGAGVAFETSIETAFKHLGFQAQRISGSGNTDVLVQWYDQKQALRTAIIDAKSTSSGHIAHSNVSDVAISAHKDKHSADFVAIVASSFAGDTIRDMALKKDWALVTAAELGEVVIAADSIGLRPADVGVLFEAPDGLSRVANLIDSRQREMDLVSLVVSRLKDEMENEEPVSPRDISLIERRSELAPSIDELISTFSLLIRLEADIVRVVDATPDAKHETYQIGDIRPAANRLRAVAAAIERGLSPSVA